MTEPVTSRLECLHGIPDEQKSREELLQELGELRSLRSGSTAANLETSDLLRAITEDTRDMIAALDTRFRYTAFNPAYQEEFRKVFGTYIGLGDSLIEALRHLPEEQARAAALWRRALEGESVSMTAEFGDPGRDRAVYEMCFTPIRNAEGRIVGAGQVARSVTERARMERALRDSEQQYRNFFELASVGAAQVDAATGRLLKANDRYCEITGYSREELLSGTVFRLTHPDDRAADREEFERLLRGETSEYGAEKRYVRRDGRVIWVHAAARLIRDDSGAPVRTVGTVLDITERKEAEEALRESEVRYRALAENAPDVIALYDRSSRCLYANPAAVAGWGRRTFEPGDNGEIAAAVRRLLQEVLENASARTAGLEVSVPDGSRHYQVRLVPEFSREGQVETVLVMGRDITELLKAKEDAEQRARELDALLDSLADGLIIYGPDHRIQRINRSALQILGLSREEIMIAPEERVRKIRLESPDGRELPLEERPGRRALRGHTVRALELIIRPENRSPVPILNSTAPIRDPSGRVVGAVQTFNDITHLKVLEKELQRARLAAEAARTEAEKGSRAKSEFLAHMSHEIRTPISAIIGLSEVLLPRLQDPEQKQFLSLIGDSARSLLTIIGNVLDLSRIEAGRVEVGSRAFSPREVMEAAAGTALLKAGEKGLSVDLKVGRGVPRVALGDPDLILRVLRNLLSNAVKYTLQGGIEARLSARTAVNGDPELIFTVTDTGIGIPAGRRHRLFETFSRLHADLMHDGPEGTGLGLAISRRLVELMGGRIGVRSMEGEGSTFRFNVPVRRASGGFPGADPPGLSEKPACPLARLRPLRLLLAEDDPVNRLFLRTALQDAGHAVTEAADGRTVLGLARISPFDLVLMDVQMPGMDGLEATRELRRLPGPAAGIPIVAVTAFALKGDEDRFLEAGMDGYVSKPVDLRQLARAIRAALRSRRRRPVLVSVCPADGSRSSCPIAAPPPAPG